METRKYAAIDGRGAIVVQQGPVPEPGPGEVLVDVHASLISSGTELGGVKRLRESPRERPPRPFGYQNAGCVIALGEGCRGLEPGMRVACMGAGYALHATVACVPQNLVFPLAENITFEEAAFNHLAATALQAVRRADVRLGEYLAVFGLGTIGQICCQLGRLAGAYVLGVDLFPLRVEKARELGAHAVALAGRDDLGAVVSELTGGHGLDAAIIAFGGDATETFKQIVRLMKTAPDTHKMGNIVIVGGARIAHEFASALGNLNVLSSARTGPGYHDEAWERGRDYPDVFVRWTTRRNVELCLRLISEGRLRVAPLITHRYPLEQVPEACEKIIQTPEETISVVLVMK